MSLLRSAGLPSHSSCSALAKAGKSVLHLDPNDYYGSEQASLTLDELVTWANSRSEASSSSSYRSAQAQRYTHTSITPLTPSLESDRRRYALSLYPSILPSRGALITILIASDVSKYVSFRALDAVSVWEEGSHSVRRVPGSKEEVFKEKGIGLVEKRRLMKFLMFAAGSFEEDSVLPGGYWDPRTLISNRQGRPTHFEIPARILQPIPRYGSLRDLRHLTLFDSG